MKRVATIASRLKEYRNSNRLTLADFSEMTGVPAQTLNRYELGQRAPKIDVAVEIAESLSINPLWLQGYDVSIEKEPTFANEGGLRKKERLIYERLSRLNSENLDIALAQLDVLLEHQENRDKK